MDGVDPKQISLPSNNYSYQNEVEKSVGVRLINMSREDNKSEPLSRIAMEHLPLRATGDYYSSLNPTIPISILYIHISEKNKIDRCNYLVEMQ